MDPSFWDNLANFGFSTLAAGGQPGATLGGAIGQGGLNAQQYGRAGQKLRSDLALQGAQTYDIGSQAQSRALQNALMLSNLNFQRQINGMPPLDLSGYGIGSPSDQSGQQSAPPDSDLAPSPTDNQPSGQTAGMPHSPTAGATVRPPRIAGSPGGTGATPQQGQPSQAQPQYGQGDQLIYGVPLSVWNGAVAPTKSQAMHMANLYRMNGANDKAAELEKYAMTAPDGFTLGSNYSLSATPGGPADPRYIQNKSSAEASGKAPAELYVARNTPKTLRGPGSLYYDPLTQTSVQIPNEVDTVGPGGTHFKQFVPLGVEITGPNGAPVNRVNGFNRGGAPSVVTGAPLGGQGQPSPILAPSGQPSPIGLPGPRPENLPAAGTPQPAQGQSGGLIPPPKIPGATQVFQTALGPGQVDTISQLAKNYGEEGRKSYESALSGLSAMEFINRDIEAMGPQGFYAMGDGADTRMGFAKMLNSWEAAAGLTPGFDVNKVGAWEDFTKETKLLGMKGLSAIFGGSREAATIVNTSISAVPHPENTYAGARLLSAAYTNGFQHEVDQRNFETNWLRDPAHPGDLTGAKEAFNQQYPPTMYARRAISMVKPYPVKDQSELKRYLPGTHVVTPDGQEHIVPGPTSLPLQGAPQ